MKVTIKGKEITLQGTFRAMIAYEQIMGHAFNPTTVTDMLVYFYSVVISNKDFKDTLTFDEFCDILDEDSTLMPSFTEWLTSKNQEDKTLEGNKTEKKRTRAAKK